MTINKNDPAFNTLRASNFLKVTTASQTFATVITTQAILNGISWNPGASLSSISLNHGISGATIGNFQNSTTSSSIMGMNVLCLSGIYYTTGAGTPDFTIYYEPVV